MSKNANVWVAEKPTSIKNFFDPLDSIEILMQSYWRYTDMVHTTFHPDLKSSLGKYTPKSFLFSLVANSVLLHIPRNYDFSLFMSNKKKSQSGNLLRSWNLKVGLEEWNKCSKVQKIGRRCKAIKGSNLKTWKSMSA